MNKGSFELTVAVPSGHGQRTKIREYGHHGNTYVEGRAGQPFSLVFKNNSAARVFAIPSVDGLCAVDGQPANTSSPGYVVPGYGQVEIHGWRTSLNDIASFVFEYKGKSYAVKGPVGDAQNCGVVAVKVFSECYTLPQIILTNYTSPTITVTYGTSDPMPEIAAFNMSTASGALGAQFHPLPQMNLGAGWGRKQNDQVYQTSFERAGELDTLIIYYSDEAGLRAAGIDVGKNVYVAATQALPQPFGGFCKPPNA